MTEIRGIYVASVSIFDDNFVKLTKQYYQKPGSKRKKIVLITDIQLCVETEFLLRYLDEKTNKKWFFTTLEDALSNISQKRDVNKTKVKI